MTPQAMQEIVSIGENQMVEFKTSFSNNYTSQSRNKLITKAFKEVWLIERYGSGIRRILTIREQYGIIKPQIEEVFDGIRFVLFKTNRNVLDDVVDNRLKLILVLITENHKSRQLNFQNS